MKIARPLLTCALLGAFAVLALGTSKPKDKDEVKITPASAIGSSEKAKAAETAKPDAEKKPPVKIGDKIDFDDASWVVTEVKDMGKKLEARFIKPATTEGRFVMVKFKLTNLAKKEVRMGEPPKIVDGAGREFGNFNRQAGYLPRELGRSFEALQPDVTKEFGAIYELPADATKLELVVTQLAWPRTAKAHVTLDL